MLGRVSQTALASQEPLAAAYTVSVDRILMDPTILKKIADTRKRVLRNSV
jgi:hypothetical protein